MKIQVLNNIYFNNSTLNKQNFQTKPSLVQKSVALQNNFYYPLNISFEGS